jgi:predicted Ser/Thr protein kinase
MPSTVGRYEILRELGHGGMAVVHLARQTDLDRLVALKELAALHTADPAAVARFLRESRMAGSLSHPSIVTVHDFFEHQGTPFIAMEYIPGGSLRRYVGRLDPTQVLGALDDVLAGLGHAERRGIVHRDLKPENLLVTEEGRIRITDFGIAKAIDRVRGATRLTATGTTIGTPNYIAPEQAMGRATGPWTDLYSLGCIAFELLVGRAPFADTDESVAVLLRHVNDPIPAVHTIDPSIDRRLSAWVENLLVKDPEQRTRSAAVAAEELDEIALELLGPRWRRSAGIAAEIREPTTPAAAGLAAAAGLGAAAGLAPTVPPTAWQPPPGGPTPPTLPLAGHAPRDGRRGRRLVRSLLWGVAVAAAIAAGLARAPGGGPTPAAQQPATATPATQQATELPAQQPTATATRPASAATPTPTPTPTPPASAGGCAGDSQSDDPSDDECGGEP